MDAYLTLPPTLNSHDNYCGNFLNTNFSTCPLLQGGRTLAATVDAYLTLPPTLNRLYTRLNGMQLTSKAKIDQLHVMSIFTKLFSKELTLQGIE